MRKNDADYKSLISEAKKFLSETETYGEEISLRKVIKTKKFKKYLSDKLIDSQIPPLFSYNEEKKDFIYN